MHQRCPIAGRTAHSARHMATSRWDVPVLPSEPQTDPLPSSPLLLPPSEVSRLLSVSPATVKRLIGNGVLPSVRIGTARRVLLTVLERFVDDLAAGRVSVEPR